MKTAAPYVVTSRAAPDLFSALIESISEAIFVIEPYTLRLLEINPKAARLLGYSAAELPALKADRIFSATEFFQQIAAASGESSLHGVELIAKGGKNLSPVLAARVVEHCGRAAVLVIACDSMPGSMINRPSSEQPTKLEEREDVIETTLEFPSIVGQSELVREVCRLIGLVAQTDTTVLIQGESGTGKELVAQAIHFHSRRNNRPLIKVNCAALTETLLESELFGHKRGAFTGAVQDRKGRFKLADGGTIILDEIDSLSLAGQAKLLRVLQEREFEPVGDSTTVRVDVRVVAITNTDLAKAISEGRFREDFYYRLNAFPIRLPPLRERKVDVPLLARHFLKGYTVSLKKQIAEIDLDTISMLIDYAWPGNVRELENTVEYAVILEKGRSLGAASLPDKLRRDPGTDCSLKCRLELAERQIILEALSNTNGVKNRAATLLGIDRRNFSYFLHKHGIQ